LVVFLVVSAAGAFAVVSAGAAAGAAVIVSGDAAGAGVAVVAVLSVAVVLLLVLLPQEATKRPIDKAKMPNFTNFIICFFGWLYLFISKTG
jgi:hypothetical protein